MSGGIITTTAGNGTYGYNGDNISATSAQLQWPGGVAVDSSGNVYFVDTAAQRIRKVSGGIITTIAGTGTSGYNGDNIIATSAQLNYPEGLAIDASGNLYIGDGHGVRKVAGGIITTIAGVSYAAALTAAGPDSVYVVDQINSRLVKVTVVGVTTVVGNGSAFEGNGGIATSAELANPTGSAMDRTGNLYLTERCAVRKMAAGTGIISTVAGTGVCGYNGDNISAMSAQLSFPSGIAVDSSGNLYIADFGNHRIRRVSSGIITTMAGNGTEGYNGDGISATSAEISYPDSIAVDSSGNFYFAESNNGRIRKVSGGIITTVAGNGSAYYNGDGISATSAALGNPSGIAVDNSGNLYIAEMYNQRIRKVSGGIITTVAGTGAQGYNGDGISATSAQLNSPQGVATDSSGISI